MSDYGRATAAQTLGPLFDRPRGEELKQTGLALTTLANESFVTLMRREAREIAAGQGSIHIDDIRQRAISLGLSPTSSAAWGPIFSEKGVWRIVGYRPSAFPTNHGHSSPVRVLVGQR